MEIVQEKLCNSKTVETKQHSGAKIYQMKWFLYLGQVKARVEAEQARADSEKAATALAGVAGECKNLEDMLKALTRLVRCVAKCRGGGRDGRVVNGRFGVCSYCVNSQNCFNVRDIDIKYLYRQPPKQRCTRRSNHLLIVQWLLFRSFARTIPVDMQPAKSNTRTIPVNMTTIYCVDTAVVIYCVVEL